MITAAALCPATPLLARELTGSDPVIPELRQACLDAVADLLTAAPDVVAVVGAGQATGTWDPGRRLDLTIFAPGLAVVPGPAVAPAPAGSARLASSAELPVPLGLGARLLDEAGYDGRRLLQSVAHDEPSGRCAEIGAGLAATSGSVALLVMADGSARRGQKAPGYLDDRSAAFDAEVERAVSDGDLGALLDVDAGLARDLMATGRPAWQVLSGAMQDSLPACQIRYSDDPFGVAYLVATLHPAPRS